MSAVNLPSLPPDLFQGCKGEQFHPNSTHKFKSVSSFNTLRFGKPVLGHVLKHVPRHVPVRHMLEHVPGHMFEHMPKHVPDRHVLDRHVPEHMLARHVLGLNKIGVHFFKC